MNLIFINLLIFLSIIVDNVFSTTTFQSTYITLNYPFQNLVSGASYEIKIPLDSTDGLSGGLNVFFFDILIGRIDFPSPSKVPQIIMIIYIFIKIININLTLFIFILLLYYFF